MGARAALSGRDFRFLLLYEGAAQGVLLDGLPVPGFSSPWLRFGPLSPRGLLREMESLSGFSAGSAVFDEDTELVLDGSLPASRDFGLFIQPLPGMLGAFAEMDGEGSARVGALGVFKTRECTAEGVVSISRAPADAESEGWYFKAPWFPGGPIAHAAARLHLDPAWLSLSLSTELSVGGWGAAGGRMQAAAGADWSVVSLDLCAGASSPGYRTPEGKIPGRDFTAGARAKVLGEDGSLELRASFSSLRRESAPHPFIPVVEKLEYAVECALPRGLRGRVSGEWSGEFDAEGEKEEHGRCIMSILWKRRKESRIDAGFTEDGILLGFDLAIGPPAFDVGFKGSVDLLEGGVEMASSLELGIKVKGGTLRVGAGFESFALAEGIGSMARKARFEVGWESRTLLP